MIDRKLWKLLKERPWLWAAKQRWVPETTDAKVERMDRDAMATRIKEVWPEVMIGTAKFWLYCVQESETGFLDDVRVVRQEVLPVVICSDNPADWGISFSASFTQGGIVSALCGKIHEIVLLRKSPDKVSGEVRVYRTPNRYRTFNQFFMDEQASQKLRELADRVMLEPLLAAFRGMRKREDAVRITFKELSDLRAIEKIHSAIAVRFMDGGGIRNLTQATYTGKLQGGTTVTLVSREYVPDIESLADTLAPYITSVTAVSK